MKLNYKNQAPITSCASCIHSYDIEYYDGCDLRCTEEFPVSAVTLYKYYSHYMDEQTLEDLRKWREILYADKTRCVASTGICDNFKMG